MNNMARAIRWTALVLALAVCVPARSLAAPAAAPPASGIALGPGSELWLDGTSTVHDFECRSRAVVLELTFDPAAAKPANAAALLECIRSGAVRAVRVRVPVASLHSEKEGLDKNLRKAMKAERFPEVRFALGTHTLGPAAGDSAAIHAQGTLTIIGNERAAALDATAKLGRDGVWLVGAYSLRMSEFGIKPPTMMLGTLRVGDRVTIHYRLLLVPTGETAGTNPGNVR